MTKTRIAAAVLLGFGLALIENHALWGYWIARPSLCGEVLGAERILGFSMLEFSPNGEVSVVPDRRAAYERAESFCAPPSNECREGSLITCLRRREAQLETLPEIEPYQLSKVLPPSVIHKWEPDGVQAAYRHSSRPARGVAIRFTRDGGARLLVGYRTSEIANDSYAYAEILFRIGPDHSTPVRRARFLLDIGGVEGLEWPVLWPANTAAALCVILIAARAKRWRAGRRSR